MRFIARLCIILLGSLALAVSLANCQQAKPIKLGLVAGLSGRGSDLGVAVRNGAMLAVEQANAQYFRDARGYIFLLTLAS